MSRETKSRIVFVNKRKNILKVTGKVIFVTMTSAVVLWVLMGFYSKHISDLVATLDDNTVVPNTIGIMTILINLLLSLMIYKMSRNSLMLSKSIEKEKSENIVNERVMIIDELYFNMKFLIANTLVHNYSGCFKKNSYFEVLSPVNFSTKLLNVNKSLPSDMIASYSDVARVIQLYNNLYNDLSSEIVESLFKETLDLASDGDKELYEFISNKGYSVLSFSYVQLLTNVLKS